VHWNCYSQQGLNRNPGLFLSLAVLLQTTDVCELLKNLASELTDLLSWNDFLTLG
jgi:hypothetical protein